MLRDVDQLTDRTFDVLVVGGGIYGLTIARDAALRGLSVALVEREDFGCGSSFNHLRTIHGGLRYLQTLDVVRARESISERRTLALIAPHAVQPVPFAVPLYRSLTKGRLAMRAGFLIERALALNRNDGVVASRRLPSNRLISRTDAIERFPGMRRQGLTGAALMHDYVTTEADRLTFAWAIAAVEAGAVLANYVEAVDLIVESGGVRGIRASDRRAGRQLEIAARLVVDASGSVFRASGEGRPSEGRQPLLKAINLVTRRDAGEEALGARLPSGRHLFLVPWRGIALFGTWESPRPCAPTERGATEPDVTSFIAELNAAFPALELSLSDVTLVHWGLVPASVRPDGTATLQRDERIRDHAAERLDGLLSVAGTKYTTARAVAQRVTDRIVGKLKAQAGPCRTKEALPGGDLGDPAAAIASARREYDTLLPSDTLPHLVAAYGSRYTNIAALAAQKPEWRSRISDPSPVVGAELIWACRHEMAVTLADVVVRRTPLGALGHPGDAAATKAAAIVGVELGWSEERRRAEVDAVRRFYEGRVPR